MKEKVKKIIFYIVFIIMLLYPIYLLIMCILDIFYDIISGIVQIVHFIKNFSIDLLIETFKTLFFTALVIGISFLVIYLWTKRDDIFMYIIFIFMIPYLYVYEQRQKKLQEYRDDLYDLYDCVNNLSNENLNIIPIEDLDHLLEKSYQLSEKYNQNKKRNDKIYNIFNFIIQIFILCCSVLFSIFIL